MTLIAVVNDVVYVDSLVSFDSATSTVSKIHEHPKGLFATAGSLDGDIIMRWYETHRLDEIYPHAVRAGVSIVMRVNSSNLEEAPGSLISLYHLDKSASFAPLHSSQGFQFSAGSGSGMFEAYWLEHRDALEAAKLTAQHQSHCGHPIETF